MTESMCRTCLAATDGSIFKTIGIDQEQLSLVEMLNTCTGLKVTKSDGISLKICDKCTYEIINSYLYHRKCWDSHNFLLRRLEEKRTIDLIKYEGSIKSKDFFLTANKKGEEHYTYVNRSLMKHMSIFHDLDEIEYTPNSEAVSDSEIITDPLLLESEQDKLSHETILLKSEMSIRSVKCEMCEKTYSSRNLLVNHLREFHNLCEDEYTAVCDGDGLDGDSEVVHEVNNALSEKELESLNSVPNILEPPNIARAHVKCEICDEIFAHRTLLVSHIHDVHKITRTPHEKIYCRKFDSLSNLQRNVEFDHVQPKNPRKSIGYFCDLVVSNARNFKTSIRGHTGKKPFKCDYCDYRSTRRTWVTTHMRRHTGDRPYKCEICNKRFAQSFSLSNHRRIHSDETPFECTVCSKKFKQRSAWRGHMAIHDPDRYVECNICGKFFAGKRNLKKHMIQHDTY